jgi:hypothetical protein
MTQTRLPAGLTRCVEFVGTARPKKRDNGDHPPSPSPPRLAARRRCVEYVSQSNIAIP